jgi:tetratricopeptide (TPR) repeat protein
MGNVTAEKPPLLSPLVPAAHLLGLSTLALLLFCVPLLVGSVHPWAMYIVTALAAVCLLGTGVSFLGQARPLRGARYAWPWALLALLPIMQLVPLPLAIRALIDSRGNELIHNAPPPPFVSFPLSLDPATTKVELLRAGLAIIVFLAALNHSAGRRGYSQLLLRTVAASSIVGVLIAIAHPLLNFDHVYGVFATGVGATLVGPFVNPNHTAQFFELGCFTSIACAFKVQDRLFRIGWLAGAGLCAAAALVTLSRASLIGLAAGGLVLLFALRPTADKAEGQPKAPRSAWIIPVSLSFAVLTLALAVALGAMPIIDEIAKTRIGTPGEKTAIWGDSLRVLWAHPWGIGRGAFDRVYPAYRTLATPVQQTFIENEVLQLLVDLGWFGFAAFVLASGFVLVAFARRMLKDRVEAAITAAMVALLAHNLFDFGFETLGLRLPFAALAGIAIGRLLGGKRPSAAGPSRTWLPISVGVIAMLIGLQGLSASHDFDTQLRNSKPADRKSLSIAAARVHPTDYFYPLSQSGDEPLRLGNKSPRLAALTRATRLCPNCSNVHRATGLTLWQLSLKSQALAEYRRSIDLDPDSRWSVFDEIYAHAGTHQDLANLRPTSPIVALGLAQSLIDRQAKDTIPREALDYARSLNADKKAIGLLNVRLALNEENLDAAFAALRELNKLEANSPTVAYWNSVVHDRKGNKRQAFAIATEASARHPDDLALARQGVYLATQLQAWGDLERAIETLKRALQAAGASVAEAYILSAQAHQQRGNLPRALRDYQTVTSIEPNNLGAWLSLAATSESGGFYTQALDAFRAVLRIQSMNPDAIAGIARIENLRQRARLDAVVAPEQNGR